MDILSGLNPQQRMAVKHAEGPALVLAGAGSGKTRVIAHRIAYLIRRGAARPENVLAVTFTNKAAREMRERVHQIVGSGRSAEPLISTFHSFCVRLLRREIHILGYRRDFSIYDTEDQRRLVKQILAEIGKMKLDRSPREILSRISFAKNQGVPPQKYAARFPSKDAEDLEEIYVRYNARLRHNNSLDFDDLLLMAGSVLDKVPELRMNYSNRYRFILVDEYQDTNRPQYELLCLLTAAHRNVFVVGDEDQSIYKFRGADIQNILKFEKDFPGARLIKLEQNYRSSQNILRVAGTVVENNSERKGKTLWTDNPSGDVVTCHRSASARREAGWIAGQIQNVLEHEPDARFAVLYRANFLSRNFEDVLMERGVPYAVVGSVAFFGRMEIKDLLAYLRILFNPEDDVAFLRIINTPPRGIGNATIEMLTRAALNKGISIFQAAHEKATDPQFPPRAARALKGLWRLIEKWSGLRDTASIAQLLETIIDDIQYEKMIEKRETAEEAQVRMANIEELVRAAAESEARGETISDFLDRASLSSELDHLDPNARVALMTLHSAKGLEFDTVFLAGMEEGLFPHSQSLATRSDLEEERRLCYVGITRARRKLFVTWTPFRKNYGSDAGVPSEASRFLKEMPAELIEGFEEEESWEYDQDDLFVELDNDDSEKYGIISQKRREPDKVRERSPLRPKSIAELKAYLAQQQNSANKSKTPSRAATGIRAGMRVRHAQFGDGIVLSRERRGKDIRLTVTFNSVGKKTLMEKYAKLEPL
jgi:DNA helicase-2/ATP-dependent DNA helicase PcrA